MTDRALLRLARDTLTVNEFHAWFAKHYRGLGRRTGSTHLGITEAAWRHRTQIADQKIAKALEQQRKDEPAA